MFIDKSTSALVHLLIIRVPAFLIHTKKRHRRRRPKMEALKIIRTAAAGSRGIRNAPAPLSSNRSSGCARVTD